MDDTIGTRDGDVASLLEHQNIKDLEIRYAVAIDSKNWPLLQSCFASDGMVDYGPEIGQHVGPDAIVAVVRGILENLDATQHLTGNYQIRVDGDEAFCVSYLHAQHYLTEAAAGLTFTLGGIYRDTLARTADGWKIKLRKLETVWTTGNAGIFEEALRAQEKFPGSIAPKRH